MPLFTYCDFIYAAGLDITSKDSIIRAFKACVKYIYIDFDAMTVLGYRDRRLWDYRICCILHKLIRYQKPSYLYELVSIGSSLRTGKL